MTGNPGSGGGIQTARFFVRSENRLAILSSLCRAPKEPAELQASLDLSRSTLRRILNELEDAGWVYTTPPEVYHPIFPARVLVDLYDPFLESMDVVSELSTFYNTLPPHVARDELDQFDVEEVRGCLERLCVTLPTRTKPYAPQQRLQELLGQLDSVRGFVPSFVPSFRQAMDQDSLEGLSAKLVLPPEEIDRIREELGQLSETTDSNGEVQLWSASTVPAFGLLLTDDGVVLIGYDEYVRPDAIVECPRDCRSIEEWATSRVETVFSDAQGVWDD